VETRQTEEAGAAFYQREPFRKLYDIPIGLFLVRSSGLEAFPAHSNNDYGLGDLLPIVSSPSGKQCPTIDRHLRLSRS